MKSERILANTITPENFSAGTILEAVENIKLETIKDYVRPYQIDGGLMRKFTAKGVQHLAQILRISIVESEYKETSNGKGLYFTTKAQTANGQSYIAHVFQAYERKRKDGTFETIRNPVEIGSTRASRNALLGLIPTDYLLRKIEQAINKGELEPSVIEQAMTKARTILKDKNDWLLKQGYTMEQAYEKAQENLGDSDAWGEIEWNIFSEVLENGSWFIAKYNQIGTELQTPF